MWRAGEQEAKNAETKKGRANGPGPKYQLIDTDQPSFPEGTTGRWLPVLTSTAGKPDMASCTRLRHPGDPHVCHAGRSAANARGSVGPALRLADQEIAERLHPGHRFQLFRVDEV